MHNRRVLSFFFANRTGAHYGEVLDLMNPLPSNSCIWTLSSCNSTSAIPCGVIEIGDVPGCNSIHKFTSLYGGNPGSSSKKTSSYSHTTRGRPKSFLASSSRVRLASQPINCSCHLEAYTVWGKTSCLSP